MTDGVDHINIYSKGATELGRALSNFADLPVQTLDGPFHSIEGYWYWLSIPPGTPRREELRLASRWHAKGLGRELRGADWVADPAFKLRIIVAMAAKLILHPDVRDQLAQSTLPFRHYYVYDDKVVEPKEGGWIIDTWEHLRRVLREG